MSRLEGRSRNVVQDIQGQDLEISWAEVNCFYRPLSLLFDSWFPNRTGFFLLYASMFNCEFVEEPEKELSWDDYRPFDDFINFFERDLGPVFGVELSTPVFADQDTLRQKVVTSIDSGGVCLIPCDLFELYYYEGYKTRHHKHFFLIKGYDFKTDLCIIVDNMHLVGVSSTRYTEFVVPFSLVFKLAQSFYQFFFHDVVERYFFVFKRVVSACQIFTDPWYLIKRKVSSELALEATTPEILSLHYAIQSPQYLDSELKRHLAYKMNMRSVYFKFLVRLLFEAKVIDQTTVDDLQQQFVSERHLWADCWSRGLLAHARQRLSYSLVKELAFKPLEKRKERLVVFEKILDKIPAVTNLGEDCWVFNPKMAQFSTDGLSLFVECRPSETFDTWLVQDNAPQILASPNKYGINIEVFAERVEFFPTIGCHFGLMLKWPDRKLLFGLCFEDSKRLVVFEPELRDSYEVATLETLSESVWLSIRTNDTHIALLYKFQIDDSWETFHVITRSDETLPNIGVFSKTWHPVHTKVHFTFRFEETSSFSSRSIQSALGKS